MKLLFQFTYSVIALIITASVSQSTKLGDKCTGDVRDILPYFYIHLSILLPTANTVSHFSRATLEYAPINADGEKSPFLPIARVVSPFIYQFSIRTIFSREGV